MIAQSIIAGEAVAPLLLNENSGSASMLLVIVGTAMATNDPMMRAVEKLSNDMDQLKEKVKKVVYKEDHIPLAFEYDRQPMYPNTREALIKIRSGGGGDDNKPSL